MFPGGKWLMSTWYVASQNPGTSTFLDTDLVAVNFWVRRSVAGLDVAGVKAVAAEGHTEWDRKTGGVKTNFARQLEQFASAMEPGDHVVTFDGARRESVLIGRVAGPYRYEDPQTISDHPHVRDVEWIGAIDRSQLPDGGAGIEHVRGVTVRRLWEASTVPAMALEDAPPSPVELSLRRPANTATPGSFAWEPTEGQHR